MRERSVSCWEAGPPPPNLDPTRFCRSAMVENWDKREVGVSTMGGGGARRGRGRGGGGAGWARSESYTRSSRPAMAAATARPGSPWGRTSAGSMSRLPLDNVVRGRRRGDPSRPDIFWLTENYSVHNDKYPDKNFHRLSRALLTRTFTDSLSLLSRNSYETM